MQIRLEAPRHRFELATDSPRTRSPLGIHVREHAENAAAGTRRGGKAVHVQPRIVFAPRGAASGNFGGTKACPLALDARFVSRAQRANQHECGIAESLQQRSKRNRFVARRLRPTKFSTGWIEA